MAALTDGTIEASRRLVADLRPPILDDLGLVPALEWYLKHVEERTKVRARLDVDAEPLDVTGPVALTAYRIVQEALTNVARHAEAKHVTVRLGTQAGALLLEITDDGAGIRADTADSPRSFGIMGMRERALAHGGALEVGPSPGGGTVVRATIPLGWRQAARGPA
jgi:signal transduction histidine kinase